nr:hypothetical protein [Limnobacter litoralis]
MASVADMPGNSPRPADQAAPCSRPRKVWRKPKQGCTKATQQAASRQHGPGANSVNQQADRHLHGRVKIKIKRRQVAQSSMAQVKTLTQLVCQHTGRDPVEKPKQVEAGRQRPDAQGKTQWWLP